MVIIIPTKTQTANTTSIYHVMLFAHLKCCLNIF